ncbi:TFIIH basal transcription factor complex, subunit SSL1 [Mytilinidion resinicola]|uniref:General transcription and DNA repair factor IIH n=1 Tax=Mytilinidion resinicola TaxID=574789 RepID=A0A6A6YTE6_9PEZI|nr:TFIIH basal transcription factor complex, subunit SSL1 [Mytilinidion resinicola]KAF2811643.1 TFIIH basal transcription factor complex, subunit SSL1 [Mytilinidion resinicola]
MADSDGEYIEASDDEYIGGGGSYGTRGRGKGKKGQRADGRAKNAWELSAKTGLESYRESADGTIGKSIQEREEERKRKRLRKDTKAFQRGIIRHIVLVLDLSEAMLEKDMRPNRYFTMIKYTQEYVREFFEQNPISQMCVMGMHDGICIRVSELSGNPADHISAIQGLRDPKSSTSKEPKGSPSLQNALEVSRATLYHTPSHGTREVIIVLGALLTLDPGDIHKTIKSCVQDRIRVSIIGMGGRMHICTQIVSRTNSGDESGYVVATDQELLRELLLATTTPPVIRSSAPTTDGAAVPAESAASLLQMGFPSRIVEEVPTLCACHGNLTRGGYTCSRCKAKVCSLPATCPGCHLTLILSTHLARSYHHLFPLRNWVEVSWQRAREKGSKQCLSCLSDFPEPPSSHIAHTENGAESSNGAANRTAAVAAASRNTAPKGKQKKDDGSNEDELATASESFRYECRDCKSHFCIDCDVFCHEVLHNCPGCLGGAGPRKEEGNVDTEMSG